MLKTFGGRLRRGLDANQDETAESMRSSNSLLPTSGPRENFDKAQKLTWKEIKCSYGFINQEAEMLDLWDPYRIHFNTHCDHTEGYQRQPYC